MCQHFLGNNILFNAFDDIAHSGSCYNDIVHTFHAVHSAAHFKAGNFPSTGNSNVENGSKIFLVILFLYIVCLKDLGNFPTASLTVCLPRCDVST